MRVGLVCPYSLTLPGGVQGQVLGLARALRASGVDAWVLAPSDGPPPEPFVTPLGRSLPTASNGSVAPIAPDVACALRTLRALRDESFDVIHLHEPLCPGPTVTALVTADVPLVGTFHRSGTSTAYVTLRPVVRWVAGRLTVRAAVSPEAAATARGAMGGDFLLLRNGVEVGRFAKASPHPADGPTIFFVGRHEQRKGLAVLLEALPSLPPDVRLWIAGDGPETARLHEATLGDPRVEWLGRISDAEVASRMRGADVYCAPSLHGESFGVVLLEAMAARTPIVASDLAGYRDVARDGQDALLVPPGEPVALGEALNRALTGGADVAAMVDSGEQRATEHSMDRLADRYAELYADIT